MMETFHELAVTKILNYIVSFFFTIIQYTHMLSKASLSEINVGREYVCNSRYYLLFILYSAPQSERQIKSLLALL